MADHGGAAAALSAGIKEIVDGGLQSVPVSFVRPPHERAALSSVLSSRHEIPVIDISGLHRPATRPALLHRISQACSDWGFFQVVNHGVEETVVEEMRAACLRFYQQPAQERNKLRSQDFEAPISYATSFNPSLEVVREWRDVLYVRDLPGICSNGFEIAPEICRKAFQDYRRGVEKLANTLYEAIFESLGLSLSYVQLAVPPIPRLIMAVNCYPECPDPSLTFGISAHSDISAITILLQDDVLGLQIRKEDEWVPVKPLSNAFVVNLGDQIQLLSNGKYKSIEHRALTNSKRMRISVACFFGPKEDQKIAPLAKLVSENTPALYKEVVFGEYMKNFYSKVLLPNRVSLQFAE